MDYIALVHILNMLLILPSEKRIQVDNSCKEKHLADRKTFRKDISGSEIVHRHKNFPKCRSCMHLKKYRNNFLRHKLGSFEKFRE